MWKYTKVLLVFIEFKGKLFNPSPKYNFEIGDECSSLYLLSNGIKPWVENTDNKFFIPKPTDANATTCIRINVNKNKNLAMISSIAQHSFCQFWNLDEIFYKCFYILNAIGFPEFGQVFIVDDSIKYVNFDKNII